MLLFHLIQVLHTIIFHHFIIVCACMQPDMFAACAVE